MALPQALSRLLGTFIRIAGINVAEVLLFLTVPLGVAAFVVESSIYDVPGGYRAVMFDRFSGVKDEVGRFIYFLPANAVLINDTGIPRRHAFFGSLASAGHPIRLSYQTSCARISSFSPNISVHTFYRTYQQQQAQKICKW
jgi:hypothetical protein